MEFHVIRYTCLILALILAAVPAMANIPSPDLCMLQMEPYAAVLYILPSGAGSTFTDARLNGEVVDATLTLTVVNNLGDPIENYPAEDIWLQPGGDSFSSCGLVNPDSNTDANGQTQWVQPLLGGGNSLGWGVQAVIAGDQVLVAAALQFVSADMNGDLIVNLSDITVFTQGLAEYDMNADFNADGSVNLSDISLMTQAIGNACP